MSESDWEFIEEHPDTGRKYWKKKERKKKGVDPTEGFPRPEEIERSREKHFPSIEDSLPQGDRD
jgi:hypothetical protein